MNDATIAQARASITPLERFAFNQARFVYHAQYTIEREEMVNGVSFAQAFERIKQTEMGQKYLKNVSLNEMKQEDKKPGSFMNANTDFGYWMPDYGGYVEDFIEK